MKASITEMDAHEQPSEALRVKWKSYVKADAGVILAGPDVDDLQSSEKLSDFCRAGVIPVDKLNHSFREICRGRGVEIRAEQDASVYYHPLMPGLLLVPSMIPAEVQKILLDHVIHRDLSNRTHQTNLHLHYEIAYPDDHQSFFSYPPSSPVRFTPKDPSIHKPLSIQQVLQRKLHWVTLGGQYDWTNRVYHCERPPEFPPDVAAFLASLFPDTRPEAAIVNIYSPGDTMMMHRDLSEETDRGLVSLSLGCEGLFMVAPGDPGKDKKKDGEDGEVEDEEKGHLLFRLRSGDALYMTGDSRFAWHGVPKVLEGTCPEYLAEWPAQDGNYEEWRGWMGGKRVNINVRQMRE